MRNRQRLLSKSGYEKTMKYSDHWIMTGWHGEQWDFQNNEKTMEHSDHCIMTGWHGEQWDFQNNEKTMKYSDHCIMTGWNGNSGNFCVLCNVGLLTRLETYQFRQRHKLLSNILDLSHVSLQHQMLLLSAAHSSLKHEYDRKSHCCGLNDCWGETQ